jgi:hypothetical protein
MLLDAIFPTASPLLKHLPPSLAEPSPRVDDPSTEPPNGAGSLESTGVQRLAVRPDGIDGWRPASQANVPRDRASHVPVGPFFAPSDSLSQPVEGDSSAQQTPVNSAADSSQPATTRQPLGEDNGEAADEATGSTPIVQFHAPQLSKVASDQHAEPSTPSADADSPTADGFTESEAPESVEQESRPAEGSAAELAPNFDDQQSSEHASESPGATASDTTAKKLEPVAPPVKPAQPLTRQLMNLRSRVRSVLAGYYRKTLNSREHDPWEVMHGMLAYEVQSRIRQGGPRGDLITTVGWLCYNKPCKGQTLLHITRDGELRAKYGVGLQGHLGQFLAMLAQCRVSEDYPIRVGKHEFTIRDLIEAEKKTCYPKSELTFKLLAFQYYLDLNETWVNDQGVDWDFPRLIREELAQPMRSAACGGTHRLSSLSLTLKARVRRSEPIDGEYARAAEFVKKYHQYAFRLQNRDGSLSTAWFNGRGDEDDIDRRIKTTGHILEWLCYSLSDEELRDPRTIRAVAYLANLMYANYNHEWEVGPMCHATHALMLYDERVFMPHDRPGYTAVYRPRRSTAMHGEPSSSRR